MSEYKKKFYISYITKQKWLASDMFNIPATANNRLQFLNSWMTSSDFRFLR